MDTHIEYIVRKKRDTKDRIKQMLFLLAGLVSTAVILAIAKYTMGVWLALVVGVWYGCFRFIRGLDKEYEYILTNDELDIDVITAKRVRKRMLTIRVREMMICAPVMDGRFDKEYLNQGGIKQTYYAAADAAGADAYFADFHLNAEPVRLIFTPNERMLRAMQAYNPRKVFLPMEMNTDD